jgi:hypothetical protein
MSQAQREMLAWHTSTTHTQHQGEGDTLDRIEIEHTSTTHIQHQGEGDTLDRIEIEHTSTTHTQHQGEGGHPR